MPADRPAIRRLPVDDEVLGRYASDLWLPYNRDLADAVAAHDLADWPEERFVERHVEFARNQLADAGSRGWVAATADGAEGTNATEIDPATADLTDPSLDLVGLLMTSVDECPDPFDRPDRLVIGEIYVAEPYRGTGLADRFVERAVTDARDHGCEQLRLDVDVDNERAMAFYERMGFEDYRKQMTVAVDRP